MKKTPNITKIKTQKPHSHWKYCTISINRQTRPMRNQATKKNSPHIDEQRQNAKAKASPITKGRQTAVKLLFKRIARGVRWGKVQSGTGAHSNCRSFAAHCEMAPRRNHKPHTSHAAALRPQQPHTHMYTRALPHIYTVMCELVLGIVKSLWFFAAPLQTAIWQILSQSKSTADEILPKNC